MNSGVCLVTNNHNWDNEKNEIIWEWLFKIEEKRFTLEWTFTLSKEVEQYIGVISFDIQDIVYGSNNDVLLFWYLFDYEPLGENKKILVWPKRNIFYLKLKTWLNEEEERFLRDYKRMQNGTKQKHEWRFLEIKEKIQKNITEERERLMHLLNDEKWHWWDLELF